MKLPAALVLVLTSLTGCVAYPVPRGNGQPDSCYGGQHREQRDRDGMRNRDDRRPNNPNRY